jgi:hypothetical protein
MTLPCIGRYHEYEPLFDIHPMTGTSIEVFYADRTLESFGRLEAGWFWWPRRRGFAPENSANGPFPTSYSAYRSAILSNDLGPNLGADVPMTKNIPVKTIVYPALMAEREGFEPRCGGALALRETD